MASLSKEAEMIYIVLFFQIVILAWLWYIEDELIPLKVETRETYKLVVGFLAKYCAEHEDYGESVFEETWKKIQAEKEHD